MCKNIYNIFGNFFKTFRNQTFLVVVPAETSSTKQSNKKRLRKIVVIIYSFFFYSIIFSLPYVNAMLMKLFFFCFVCVRDTVSCALCMFVFVSCFGMFLLYAVCVIFFCCCHIYKHFFAVAAACLSSRRGAGKRCAAKRTNTSCSLNTRKRCEQRTHATHDN